MWAGASPHKAPSLGGPMRELGVSKIVSRMQAGASRGGSIFARYPTCSSLHAPTPPPWWSQGGQECPQAPLPIVALAGWWLGSGHEGA